MQGHTASANGWPFSVGGRRRYLYDPRALPQTVAILERALTYQVPVRMSAERSQALHDGLAMVARTL